MKLFTRYFRINLLATLVIFLLASVAFYFLLWWVMINQVDEDLKIEQREIQTYVAKYNRAPEPITVKDQRISYEPAGITERTRNFSTIKSSDANEREDFRQISFTIPVGDKWLLFKVSKSLEGTRDMNRSIIMISLLTVVLILLVSIFINRWLLRRLWKPFYATLTSMNKFRLGEKNTPSFDPTDIDEFSLLNKTLDQFIKNADKEYTLLKEFTENASHELQTPLAIVRSKLDTLIQDEHLTEPQSNAAQTAYEAIRKMAKLNQSLLLLSKIENKQFSEISSFDFKKPVEEKLTDWQELWQGKNIKISSQLESVAVKMNTQLADILLNNLFSNATQHVAQNGAIQVSLQNNEFSISNTAQNGALDQNKLFKRFSKAGQATDQHGLGLSILQQIAEVSGMSIAYEFGNGIHIFTVRF
jgi:two-component system, OmpR family, sensor histidine kinase QseC